MRSDDPYWPWRKRQSREKGREQAGRKRFSLGGSSGTILAQLAGTHEAPKEKGAGPPIEPAAPNRSVDATVADFAVQLGRASLCRRLVLVVALAEQEHAIVLEEEVIDRQRRGRHRALGVARDGGDVVHAAHGPVGDTAEIERV